MSSSSVGFDYSLDGGRSIESSLIYINMHGYSFPILLACLTVDAMEGELFAYLACGLFVLYDG